MLRWGTYLVALLLTTFAMAQSKLNVTITNPSVIDVCVASDFLQIEVRNITTSNVTSIQTTVTLPTGLEYVAGSLSGSCATENSITNLSQPVFDVSDLGVASACVIKIRLKANCDLLPLVNKGALIEVKTSTTYSGGSVSKTSSPLNVKQPSLQISSITNQLASVDLGQRFVRTVTIKNSGTGIVKDFELLRVYQKGLKIVGTSANNTSSSGDSTNTLIDSAMLSAVGDKDGFLDLNEVIVISDTILVQKCTDLNASYFLLWGCEGKYCNIVKENASANISTKKPVLVFIPQPTVSNCISSGEMHDQRLIIVNNGTDTARTIKLHVFQSVNTGYYSNMLSQIHFNSFKYASSLADTGKTITPYSASNTNSSGIFSCLGSNAVGEVYLNIPIIAPGDSAIVDWQTSSCCPSGCNANGLYAQRWKFDAQYIDQCGDNIKTPEYWGTGGMYQGFSMSKFNPTDVVDGKDAILEYTVVGGALFRPIARSQFRLQLVLTKGLTHSKKASDFQFVHPNGTSWSPKYFITSGDTVTAVFTGPPMGNWVRSELLIKITTDCNGTTNNKVVNYQLNAFYNPDTTCSSNCWMGVYCDTDKIKLHCATSCKAGLHFKDFEAVRTSYGFPDNDNDGLPDATGKLDLDKIKRNRVMYGDTIQTSFRARVYNAGTITKWTYGKATSTIAWGAYLDVADVRIKIYRTGGLLFNCNNINYTTTTTGNNKTVTVDIGYNNLVSSGCSLYSSFGYLRVDSVELIITYVVASNPGNSLRTLEFNNDFYLSSVANPTASQKYQCDSFSARLSLVGYYFTNYGRNVYTNRGCDPFNAYQNFYLSVGPCCANYGGGNIFPYEYRPWAKLTGVILEKSDGYGVLQTEISQYRTAGTGTTKTDNLVGLKPSSKSSTTWVYSTDSLYKDKGGSFPISDDGFHGTLRFNLQPNCKLVDGSYTINYGFIFERKGYLGTGYDTVFNLTQNDLVNYEKPRFTLTPKSKSIYAESDTVEWEVRLSNQAVSAGAENVWLHAKGGSATVFEVIDLKTNKVIGPNIDIFKVGTLKALEQKDLLIRAYYSGCSADSIWLGVGYNCTGYPDSFGANSCTVLDQVYLNYEPINTRLEANILDSSKVVDLCEEASYRLEVRNTGSPKVYGLYLDMLLRPGMVLNDTAWMHINGRTDSVKVVNPVYQGSNTYRWYLADADSQLYKNGLNGVRSSSGYSLVLTIKLTTDCNFTSSTFFLVKAGGQLKCGDPVNASFTVGDPIDIKGVQKSYFSALSLSLNHLDACNYDPYGSVTFLNLGADTTGVKDKIILSLPEGMRIDTNYVFSGHNIPQSKPAYRYLNGENVYSFDIPHGITAGDSCSFDLLTILDQKKLDCGTKQIFAQAVIEQTVLCVKDSTYCDINVATSSILRTDSVEKGIYQLNFISAQSVPKGSDESVTLSYLVSNSGSDKLASSPLLVDVVYDKNGNGLADSNESIIATDTVLPAILSGSGLSRTLTFDVAADLTCDLILSISDLNCTCKPTTALIPTIQLLNAGEDTLVCPLTPLTIGLPGNSSLKYSWNNTQFVGSKDSSITVFTGVNLSNEVDTVEMILLTDKGKCRSQDTVKIFVHPQMQANLKDTVGLCRGDQVIIGQVIQGGVGTFKTYQWSPVDSLSKPAGVKTLAYPDLSTTYSIVVTDMAGCKFKDSTHVKVSAKPDARISMQDDCAGDLFAFADSSEYYGTRSDSVSWSVGDLGIFKGQNIQLLIDSSYKMNVELFVQNVEGCFDTTAAILEVYPIPQPQLSYVSVCEGEDVVVRSTSTITYGSINAEWLAESKSYTGDSMMITMPYKADIEVLLKVTSDRGCIDSLKDTLPILDRPEVVVDLYNACLNAENDLKTIVRPGTKDSITNYVWDLGDGSTVNGKDIKHTYSDTGWYTAVITVQNLQGCVYRDIGSLRVYELPLASFNAIPVCEGETSVLVSQSTISTAQITKYWWDTGSGFQPGGSSTQLNRLEGSHIAKLMVQSNEGCLDTFESTFDVYHVEIPQWVVNGHCDNEFILMNSKPQYVDSVSNIWWVLEGDTTMASAISHKFGASGRYKVQQIVETNRGCFSSKEFILDVDPSPKAVIDLEIICNDNQVRFASAGFKNYWDFGDGETSTANQGVHDYPSVGSYLMKLSVENSFGCFDSTSVPVTIDHFVIPDLKISSICEADAQFVVNMTRGFGTPLSKAEFHMGNGDVIRSYDSFQYTFYKPGNYDVTLKVSTKAGCDYDTVKNIDVYPLPEAGFDLNPDATNVFAPFVNIVDQSTGSDNMVYTVSDGSSYVDQPNVTHEFLDSGNYAVKQWVVTQFGCMDSLTKDIYIDYAYKLFIPNAFSPNADGHNDVFRPTAFGMVSYEMHIYNRWGELIFVSDVNEPWTGEGAFQGAYMYHIRVVDYAGGVHNYSGTVLLLE